MWLSPHLWHYLQQLGGCIHHNFIVHLLLPALQDERCAGLDSINLQGIGRLRGCGMVLALCKQGMGRMDFHTLPSACKRENRGHSHLLLVGLLEFGVLELMLVVPGPPVHPSRSCSSLIYSESMIEAVPASSCASVRASSLGDNWGFAQINRSTASSQFHYKRAASYVELLLHISVQNYRKIRFF